MNKILNNELKKIFNAQKKNINDNTMDMLIQQVYSDPDYYKIKAKYNRYKRLMNESNKATIMTPIISATNLKSNNDKKYHTK